MYLYLDFNAFELVRGDSFEFSIELQDDNRLSPTPYYPTETELLYVGIMEPNQSFESALVKKVLNNTDIDTAGNRIFSLTADETERIQVGKYYIQIKLFNTQTNVVKTVLKPTVFNIIGTKL